MFGLDKRRHRRVALKTRVDVDSESNFYTGFAENISDGGLFVATEQPRDIGECLTVRFTLPDGGAPLVVEAVVRWVREPDASTELAAGYGIEFTGLAARDAARIQAFIERRAPIFYMA